jgi:hypothetical protein
VRREFLDIVEPLQFGPDRLVGHGSILASRCSFPFVL